MYESFSSHLRYFAVLVEIIVLFHLILIVSIIKCSRKNNNSLGSNKAVSSSQKEINRNGSAEMEKSDRDSGKLEVGRLRDSIKLAKTNQQKSAGSPKTTKMLFTKSRSAKEESKSHCDSSIKFISADSLTEEIIVPVGKTARAPVPQSSLTSLRNQKTHGQPRNDSTAVTFGEERISATRVKPVNSPL